MKLFPRVLLYSVLLTLLSLPTQKSLAQQSATVNEASPPLDPPSPFDPTEMEAFFDTQILAQLEEYGIPGAAVAVVVDGEIFFSKGYGYANYDTQKPVVAEKTLFHIGSVTKLFTWTAVMQLVERGQIDLDADINTYISALQFPDTFPQPITMKHLLTHTPGLEDRLSNLLRVNKYDGVSLETFVVRQQPTRILPPGELIGYSNYGGALAGYIVQQVSGLSYEQYIEGHIFAPLSMRQSSIRQPVRAELVDDVSLGHIGGPGGIMTRIEYFPSAPMVGGSASVTDMGKFMIAHLQQGRYGENRILQYHTARVMHQQQFTHDPRLPGVTYGFVEWARNNQRMLWHSGSTPLFQCLLLLLPEENVGMFVAYNRKTGRIETGKLLRQAFLDHYYPMTSPLPTSLPDSETRVKRFAGDYRESRWAHTTADRFIYMLTRYYEANANRDGSLTFMGNTYVEVEPLLFRQVDGQGVLIFREDAQGHITHGFSDYDPHKVFIKLKWYETLDFQISIIAVCVATFISIWFKRHAPQTPSQHLLGHTQALYLMQGVSIINLLYPPSMFIIGLSVIVQPLPNLAPFAALFGAALIAALLIATLTMLFAWAEKYGTIWARIHYTFIAIAAGVMYVWYYAWNLLGLWHF